MVMIMILAQPSQNSVSPKLLTCRICQICYLEHLSSTIGQIEKWITLMVITATPKTVIQIATLRSGLQYCMTRPAAVRLVGVAMIYLRK